MGNKFARHLILNFIIGSAYIVLQLLAFLYLGNLVHHELKGSLIDLASGSGSGDIGLVAISIFGLLVTGFLIYAMAWLKHFLAPHLGLEKSKGPSFGKEKIVAVVATLIGLGIVAQFVFLGFGQMVTAYSPTTNLASLNSLASAIMAGNFIVAGIAWVVITIFGALILLVGSTINTIERRLPSKFS